MENQIDWKKYLLVFLITLSLFFCGIYLSNYFGSKKIDQLKAIQDKISINILSSETQFSLLSDMSCKNVSGSVLSAELEDLGNKLEWGQKNLGTGEEVTYLKQYYSLLQIKDYLLMKKVSARCGVKSAFILYFYTTAENCSLCDREGMVLATLRNKYPELRVYSFDYSIDLSAVKALLNIYKIKDTALPALIIDDNLLTGFHGVDEIDARVKESFKLQEVTPLDNSKKSS